MLFIYGALSVGGIETFFVRMAKQRHKNNLKTKIILLSEKKDSNSELLTEMLRYAEVYFVSDVFYELGFISKKLHLLAPIKNDVIYDLLYDVDHVHVTHGAHALLALRFLEYTDKKIYITVGFYHSKEFSWGDPSNLPYYERKNREFIFKALPKRNIYLFSESLITLYKNLLGVDLTGAKTFRIGVIERVQTKSYSTKSDFENLKICSVGRLVDFKTYNLWMLDVVKKFVIDGFPIEYHIYGTGPLSTLINERIANLQLEKYVMLKGGLDYSQFENTVSRYDLFVGSGTSIIQASSLGVCSIIAIESNQEPTSYGFFHENCHFDYNFEHPKINKFPVIELIKEYIHMGNEEKKFLSIQHINAVEPFFMDSCSVNFDDIDLLEYQEKIKYSKILYTITYLIKKLKVKLKIDSIYHSF